MTRSRKHPEFARATLFLVFVFALLSAGLATFAQTPTETYQRTYPNSKDDLQAAVHTVQPLSRGRLPILDGFVIPQGQPLSSYSRGYYECDLQVLTIGSGQTIVRATAKVTAWFTDPDASRSGYRVLPSNGRLENDALDRIEEALADATVANSPGTYSSSLKTDPASPAGGGISPSITSSKPLHDAPGTAAPNPASTESIETIRTQREDNERKAVQLAGEEKNLEDILHNQSRPSDLIVVKRASTPIFSKAEEGAQVLMSADAHDEFQILGLEGAWVHVQISGVSRGWLRRAQVELPPAFGGGAVAAAPESAQNSPNEIFHVEKEETSAFSGKWEPLSGKKVRVVWVAPLDPAATSSARQKKSFAKAAFLKAYSEQKSATPPIEGVVVLFDSADGGQIAATTATLQQLESGALTETVFWKQCSVDPPEVLQDAGKPVARTAQQKN
ncbi:MAG TPA: hypothetical protein VGD60_06100 [Candidatus Acidoferrales bacterium]